MNGSRWGLAALFLMGWCGMAFAMGGEPPPQQATQQQATPQNCYPGLACPGGPASGQQEPPPREEPEQQQLRGSFGSNFHYVGTVRPPDPWLALRTEPSARKGRRIMKMPQGTLLRQIERRGLWWYVELTTGERGWAHSKWIKCCKTLDD